MTPAQAERTFLLARLADVTAERDALAAQVQAVRRVTDDLWRVSPCGCGHRADLHKPDEGICIGGLTLCDCRWSFSLIVQTRIRAALADAPGTEDA